MSKSNTSSASKSRKSTNADDLAIGQKIRARRMTIGMSQEKLGDALGVTFQQIQKYERGVNRIGGSRMVQIAAALKAPPAYFFPDESAEAPQQEPASDEEMKISLIVRQLSRDDQRLARKLVQTLLREAEARATVSSTGPREARFMDKFASLHAAE